MFILPVTEVRTGPETLHLHAAYGQWEMETLNVINESYIHNFPSLGENDKENTKTHSPKTPDTFGAGKAVLTH